MQDSQIQHRDTPTNTITLDGEALDDVETFKYLVISSIIDEQEEQDANVKEKIGIGRKDSIRTIEQTIYAT
ncbi:unnamed protein product [Schistosoma margrebowiei]|uniref:Uncharacterized protein n=1 Tax=Schistosoma margrebowiei TaxID=48269 RepID=A0A183LU05_9TREM|nr:unnamed protein product [Schistosoma margrebowiei]